jgi:hypothetical protein
MAAIINRLPTKLPESRFQSKANFARAFCHFSIQPANKPDHTPIDKHQPFSAPNHGISIQGHNFETAEWRALPGSAASDRWSNAGATRAGVIRKITDELITAKGVKPTVTTTGKDLLLQGLFRATGSTLHC